MVFSHQMKSNAEKRFDAVTDKLREPLKSQFLNGIKGESDDVKFLAEWAIGFSPLSDLINYGYEFFHDLATHAAFLLNNGFCEGVPENIFLNFVLPVRLGTEQLCNCRKFFFELLKERISGLSAYDKIIEVNYFNAENVKYQSTDFRTMSALATFNAGYGRCGEETVFAVNVYRAVGIPARQVYAPRWSHCDDNHAWIEVWCDGKWHFAGACEPEEVLDRGWFNAASSRAMFVGSTVFGEPKGESFNGGLAPFCNCIEQYVSAKRITVRVIDKSDKPIEGASVRFEILNNSHFYPCAKLVTDSCGEVSLLTGSGSINLRVRSGEQTTEKLIDTRVESEFVIKLISTEKKNTWVDFEFVSPIGGQNGTVPSDEQKRVGEIKRKAASAKLEDKVRGFFDEEKAERLIEKFGYKRFVYDFLLSSRGNFLPLYDFLSDERFSPESKERLIKTLYEKDALDIDPSVLTESLELADGDGEFYYTNVLCPRVWFEPLYKCRKFIRGFFSDEQKREFASNPRKVWEYVNTLSSFDSLEYGHLITSPQGALVNQSGSYLTKKVLFVIICRALNVPARFNPVHLLAEFYDGKEFVCVENTEEGDCTVIIESDEKVTYLTDFTIGVLSDGNYSNLELGDFDGHRAEIKVKSGTYRIITDNRLPNGNIHASKYVFDISRGETKRIKLHKFGAELSEMLSDYSFEDFDVMTGGKTVPLGKLTEGGAVIIRLGDGEPTRHLIDEIKSRKEFDKINVVLLSDGTSDETEKANKILRGATKCVCDNKTALEMLSRKLFLDPDLLPLIAVVKGTKSVYASCGYNVGSVDLTIKVCKNQGLYKE